VVYLFGLSLSVNSLCQDDSADRLLAAMTCGAIFFPFFMRIFSKYDAAWLCFFFPFKSKKFKKEFIIHQFDKSGSS
jgi:hypothetical protein